MSSLLATKFVPKLPRIVCPAALALEKSLFQITFSVVSVKLPSKNVQKFLYALPYDSVLAVPKLKPIQPISDDKNSRKILLARQNVDETGKEIGSEIIEKFEAVLMEESVTLNYDNWSADDILASVLPEGSDAPSSYETVGHLIRLNLPEEMEDRVASIIGQVLIDKLPHIKTVVRKIANISNQFRVLPLKLVAGTEDYVVSVKESECTFKFDYSTVYWNSRLQYEHGVLVSSLFAPGQVVVDMFCGVGPFALPATRLGCIVYANDLNPESYKWLLENININKIDKAKIFPYNLDAREFIQKMSENVDHVDHVIMNLPASSVEFLDLFPCKGFEEALIHCYLFAKTSEDPVELVRGHIRDNFQMINPRVTNVRNVSPNKDMYRVSFKLSCDVKNDNEEEGTEESRKKLKLK
jgi:tRNA (guanine37-N1)-methyltransferase